MKTLALLAAVLVFVDVSTVATAYAEESGVSVVKQQVYSNGYVMVYVSGLSGEAYSLLYLQIGVGYPSEQHPVYLKVDGRILEKIVEDGLYTIIIELEPGNHRIAIRTNHAVLYSTVVYVRPKTLPEMIQMTLRQFMEMLRQIRARDIVASLAAAAVGVVLALKLRTTWPVLPLVAAYGPTLVVAVGLYLYDQGVVEGLYALPFAAAYAIAYQLAPDLSVSLLILRYLGGGTVSLERIKMYHGRVMKARFLSVKSKRVEVKETIFNCIVHGMRKIGTAILVPAVDVKEEDGVIKIESDRDLAAAIEAGTVARLRQKLEELMQENMKLRYVAGTEAIERLRKLSSQ